MSGIISILLMMSQKIGYWGIVILMTIESSFIPFPSEVVIPPAGYLARLGEMNIYLVIIAGIAGSLLGATINYILAMTLGRTVIYYLADHKCTNILLLNKDKMEKAERYFRQHGNISTFIGRLVVGVRQLVSIPAGFARMNFVAFIFFTFLGSSIWVIILALLGYMLGGNEEILYHFYNLIKYGILILVVFGGVIWYLKKSKVSNTDVNLRK